MKNEYILYGAVIFGVVVLAWSITSLFQSNAVGSAKYNYYQSQAQQAGSECGDMKDLSNVQHLSHHSEQFADCLKQVDPQIFEQAVGQKKEDYMKEKGIN